MVPTSPRAYAAAFAHAQTLRQNGEYIPVELDLSPHSSPSAVRQYARDRRIAQIAWIKGEGNAEIEIVG